MQDKDMMFTHIVGSEAGGYFLLMFINLNRAVLCTPV